MSPETTSKRAIRSNSSVGVIVLGIAAMLLLVTVGYREWVSNSDFGMSASQGIGQISIDELRERAENSSGDAEPWQELGFAYFQRGEFVEAADAYRRAVTIDGDVAVLWSALGEALVMASNRDPMPAEALAAFQKASEIDASDPRARYFLAVNRDLGGDHQGAIDDWFALLRDTAPGAPWERDLVRTIEQVGAINAIEVSQQLNLMLAERRSAPAMASNEISGPTASEIAAAGRIPPSEQREMAEGMVARLEQRLAGDPQNLDGWVMLMRSRMTLEQPQRARTALNAAIAANPASESRLRSEAEALGIR